jgi:hypothetical protein
MDHFQSFKVEQFSYVCPTCGFHSIEDLDFSVAKKESDRKVVNDIINELSELNIKASNIERVFGLAPKTINRWKSQGISAGSLAFLKVISSCNWVIRIAEHKYDPIEVNNILREEFINSYIKESKQAGVYITTGCIPTEEGYSNVAIGAINLNSNNKTVSLGTSDDFIEVDMGYFVAGKV